MYNDMNVSMQLKKSSVTFSIWAKVGCINLAFAV